MRAPLLSVVVPVYCEEQVLREFYARTKAALRTLEPGLGHEIIFVNDGSTDGSLEILKDLAAKDRAVSVIELSRNFGHQVAITAGIDHAVGDGVVVIDNDLQDPPEVIVRMVEKWRAGYQVVYGVRERRKGERIFKRLTANLYYRLLDKLADIRLPHDSGDFRLMDRVVVEAFKSIREESRYVRGLIAWVGFRQCPLGYERDARYAGETKFTVRKMLRLGLDGITSFSDRPLRFVAQFGFLVTLIAVALIAYVVIGKLINPHAVVQGWTSVVVVMLFMGGVQLLSVGILGEYIGRIYRQTKHRPLYIVAQRYGGLDALSVGPDREPVRRAEQG